MLPTFLVIGAMKGGSTSLFAYVRAHPDVFMPSQKELHFFSEHNWWRGIEWYEAHFDGAGDALAVGEASPGYSRYPVSPDACPNIAATLPDARLVYVIRHPVERLVSQYQHLVATGDERRPADEAVLDEDLYLSTSRYALQLERYLDHFRREQVLVVTADDLRQRRGETVATVFRHLGVDPHRASAALGVEHGRGDQRRREPGALRRLRTTPIHAAARRFVPAATRAAAWRALTRPTAPVAGPSPAALAEAAHRLAADTARLRLHLGPHFHCWGMG